MRVYFIVPNTPHLIGITDSLTSQPGSQGLVPPMYLLAQPFSYNSLALGANVYIVVKT